MCDLRTASFHSCCSTQNLTALNGRKPLSSFVQEWVDAPNFAIHPLTTITKSAHKDTHAHVGGLTHTCMHMMCAHAHRSKPMRSQVLSGLTLNKWSIHLSSQNMLSVTRCCRMSHSIITPDTKMSYNQVIPHHSQTKWKWKWSWAEQVKQALY